MKGTGFLPARADSTPGRQGSFWGTLTRAPFVRLASRGPAFVLLTVYCSTSGVGRSALG